MRVRWVAGRARVRRRTTAVLFSAVAMFAALATSACTGSGTPSAGASASSSFFTAKGPSGTATATVTTIPTTPPPTATASPSPSPSPSPFYSTAAPVGAPSTGGGGTAGLQHAGLFAFGGLAVLVGLISLLYRRRTLRR